MKILGDIYFVLLILFLTITLIIYKIFTMELTQGQVYCTIFLFVSIIGFTGLANILFYN